MHLLEKGQKSLAASTDRDLNFLEGVANVRFALLLVADLLQQLSGRGDGATSVNKPHIVHGDTANQLIEIAKEACTRIDLNTIDLTGKRNTAGPVIYLMKLIVRQWGFDCLNNILKSHQWVVPVDLRQSEVSSGVLECVGIDVYR